MTFSNNKKWKSLWENVILDSHPKYIKKSKSHLRFGETYDKIISIDSIRRESFSIKLKYTCTFERNNQNVYVDVHDCQFVTLGFSLETFFS